MREGHLLVLEFVDESGPVSVHKVLRLDMAMEFLRYFAEAIEVDLSHLDLGEFPEWEDYLDEWLVTADLNVSVLAQLVADYAFNVRGIHQLFKNDSATGHELIRDMAAEVLIWTIEMLEFRRDSSQVE